MSFYMLLWGEAFRKTDSEFMLVRKNVWKSRVVFKYGITGIKKDIYKMVCWGWEPCVFLISSLLITEINRDLK